MRGLLACVLVAALLSGCGSEGDGDGIDRTRPLHWSSDPATEVLRVSAGGGLPSPEQAPDRFVVPDLVLYGDGLVVWRTAGPFRSAELDSKGVRQVLVWARDAGLLEPGGVDTGEPLVYDVPGVVYAVTTTGGTETTRVIAPGLENQHDLGLDDDETAARKRLEKFERRVFTLPETMPDTRFARAPGALDVPGWEVLSRRTTGSTELQGDEPTWTLDDLGAVGRCRVLTGAAAQELEGLVDDPGEATYWQLEGVRWVVFARPLLRGSADPCPKGE